MLKHLDFEKHMFEKKNFSQMDIVTDKGVEKFSVEKPVDKIQRHSTEENVISMHNQLCLGWAIPKRIIRRLTSDQKDFLNNLFDEGEKSKSKITPEAAVKKMKDKFEPHDFLPLNTIKSYFSRQAKKIRAGVSNTEPDDMQEEDNEENATNTSDGVIPETEANVEDVIAGILHDVTTVPDLQLDDWIAVDMGSCWFPAQLICYDQEEEELHANFLHRSQSNKNWFVWPQYELNGLEDKAWVTENAVFYRLTSPREGRRMTLLFSEIADVETEFVKRK